MDYGNNAHLGSNDPSQRAGASSVCADVPNQQSENSKPLGRAAAATATVCDIKHPLAAILTNANAARRWLNGPDANLAEAMTALDRIANDVVRIDAALDAFHAAPTVK